MPGTDYARVPERTLTILSGETVGTATFRLAPLDNDSADGARTLSVTGSTTVAELRIEPATGARIALDNDDSPALLVAPAALTVVEAGSDTYRVELQTRPTAQVTVTITGIDDAGVSPGSTVALTVPSGASRTIEAADLEAGAEGFDGSLGDGLGKWRLRVESDQPIVVMSLLSSPTGHLTNLSSVPDRGPY